MISGSAGQVSGPVESTNLQVGHHNVLAGPVYVGVPGSLASEVPQLASPVMIRVPTGLRALRQIVGQGGSASRLGKRSVHLVVLGRCYGPSPLRVDYWNGIVEKIVGTFACDDGVHEIGTYVGRSSGHGEIIVRGGQLDAFRLVLVAKR